MSDNTWEASRHSNQKQNDRSVIIPYLLLPELWPTSYLINRTSFFLY